MTATNQTLLPELFRWMAVGRAFEAVMAGANPHWHGARGEEGVLVGSFYGLRPTDIGLPHYRGALYLSLMRGAPMRLLYAGALGKVTGPTRGRWRGDVCGPFRLNQIGALSGSLGPSFAYATGAALAFKLRRQDGVAVVNFGDGTANSGLFHESLNMAAMLRCPAVFVCQNNQYAISMPSGRAIAGGSVAARGAGYGIPAVTVDGNDVVAVHDAVQAAIARARRGDGPSLIEAVTYRADGHWVTDAATYRPAGEAEQWAAGDPVERLRRRLLADGLMTAGAMDRLAAAAADEAAAALAAAQADDEPATEPFGSAYATPIAEATQWHG